MGHRRWIQSTPREDSTSVPALLTAATVLLLSRPAVQEGTTADGIDAFFRGDYSRAAEILTKAEERADGAAAFFLARIDGCGFIYLYAWSSDRTELMTVSAEQDLLQLSTTPRTFDLSVPQSGLELLVHVYEQTVRNWPFCTDVIIDQTQRQVWRAQRGTITIALAPARVPTNLPGRQRATIRIVDAEFVDPSGRTVQQIQPIVLTGIVGWLAGG